MLSTRYGMFNAPECVDDLIIDSLRTYGEWGVLETRILAHLLPNNAVLWDCGAFLGTFTLGVARETCLASALAVEANADLVPYLSSNLSRLAPCPTIVVHGGVGACNGFIAPSALVDLAHNLGAQSYGYVDSHDGSPDIVACSTLQKLRSQHGDYTALKLDIEGLEVDAIKGDYAYIAKNQPILWAECNETKYSLKILSAMKSLGYEPIYIAFPAFRADNHRGERELLYPLAYEAALIAAPNNLLGRVDWNARVFDDTILRSVQTHNDLRKALFDTPRWGRKEWLGLSKSELLGRLSRIVNGQTLKNFLS